MARQPRRLPTPPRRVWESAGRAAPQKGHPLGVAAALAALPQSTAPRGLPGPEPVPQQTRSGRRRGRALSSCGSRHRLPAVPARAALTASSLGASAGGGGVRPRSDPSPVAPGPGPQPPPGARRALPPGSPAPSPALSSRPRAPTPPARSCLHRGDQRGSRGAGCGVSVPARGAPGPPTQGGAVSSLISALPLPGLGRTWESRGSGKESGLHRLSLEGGLGECYTALLFLLSTAFLKVIS